LDVLPAVWLRTLFRGRKSLHIPEEKNPQVGTLYLLYFKIYLNYRFAVYNFQSRSQTFGQKEIQEKITKNRSEFHNFLSTAPQLSISQKALGTLPEDGNVMPKHVGNTIYN
jgi:hypothetical protein